LFILAFAPALLADGLPQSEAEVRRLVQQLGAEKSKDREAAAQKLEGLGAAALAELRSAAKADPDAEVRVRAGRLVKIITKNVDVAARQQFGSPHQSVVLSIALSKDNRVVALSGGDRSISVHDWPMGKLRAHLKGLAKRVWSTAFSPDGRYLACCTGIWEKPLQGGEIRIWDLRTGKSIRELPRQPALVHSVLFSLDGKSLYTGDWNGTFKVWDVATGQMTRSLQAHPKALRRMVYSPDGKSVVTAGIDGTIRFWDALTLQPQKTLTGHEWGVQCLAFSPGGAYLAATNHPGRPKPEMPGEIKFWELAGGREPVILAGSERPILSLDFSPDGRTLAAGGGWAQVSDLKLFEVASGRLRAELGKPKEWVEGVKFTPDGRAVLSVGGWSRDIPGEVRLWPLPEFPARAGQADLSATELQKLWDDLAGEDAAQAYRAVGVLSASPPSALSLLQARLKPATSADPKRLARLIAALDDGQYRVREEATKELTELGDQARVALRKALAGQLTAEARQRIARLLQRVEIPLPPAEPLRQVRAVEALERVGTAESREFLRRLAGGAPEARLTQEAGAALARVGDRADPPDGPRK
jgi:WD40 repeat protein